VYSGLHTTEGNGEMDTLNNKVSKSRPSCNAQ